jgi:hypothetical protein
MAPDQLHPRPSRQTQGFVPGQPANPAPAVSGASFEQASRHSILSHLFEHLKTAYDIDPPNEKPAGNPLPRQGIEALLAFKTDSILDELHGALHRLDEGTFGICIACKRRMNQTLLDSDPIRRLCPECERKLLF